MKKNSKMILLSLFYKKPPIQQVSVDVLHMLFPDLTQSGWKSLIHYLESDGYLHIHQLGKTKSASLSEKGRRTVMAHFPALDEVWLDWNGGWSVMLFLESPVADPQFRNLRRLLIKDNCYQIKRGIYITPHKFSSNIISLCQSLYSQSILIGTISSWNFGFELNTIFRGLSLFDIHEVFSGISKEINDLLRDFLQNKSPTDIEKKQLFLVFDRYYENLSQDPGFIRYYFPKLIDPFVLLGRLQQLFHLVEVDE